MSSVSRTAQFAHVFKVLKRHYKPIAPDAQRSVLEQLLLGCCLEDAHYEAGHEAYAGLVHTFFDWNEVRVTTIAELSETLSGLPDPRAAANRLKRVLQSVFEAMYAFDLEEYRKKNLGPTIKWLSKIDGTTNFTVSYVVQSALGGHAIPIDSGVLGVLRIVELVTDEDVEAGVVPGLERAIPKAKGVEFGSLLHQLGADFTANPYSPAVHKILLEIDPDVKDRLPKRRAKKLPPKEKKEADRQRDRKRGESSGTAGDQTTDATGKSEPSSGEKTSPVVKKKSGAAGKKPRGSKQGASAAKKSAQADRKRGKSASDGISKRKPR
ncbi:MAG: hypothetical protein A2V70_12765 [Planctomycetes bacterium RBG_13_63_9]|nr:MAG: hypothetical protein A2V70_12765 [Planctomycetes bacterium RBG_13_63_9]